VACPRDLLDTSASNAPASSDTRGRLDQPRVRGRPPRRVDHGVVDAAGLSSIPTSPQRVLTCRDSADVMALLAANFQRPPWFRASSCARSAPAGATRRRAPRSCGSSSRRRVSRRYARPHHRPT
jgi:hypothetical protein